MMCVGVRHPERSSVMGILIKNTHIGGEMCDIHIEGEQIKEIGREFTFTADENIDARGMAAIPSFVNVHTHAAMTLLRGYADDMFLQEWLEKKIWPVETSLTEEDVYWGAKLACLEMIKGGTTLFNDMYWFWHGTVRAVQEMGLRASISAVFIDRFDVEKAREQQRQNELLFEESRKLSPQIIFSLGPHAIYTVSPESLIWCKEFSQSHGLLINLHLSETSREVEDCLKTHGLRPVEYLEKLGFLSPRVILAHCVWLNDREIEILKEHDVTVVHNPVSNMKLAVGSALPYSKLRRAGVRITLGTDGCSSNNNLDMLETMKWASLLQKYHNNDCCALPAPEVFDMATSEGAEALGVDIGRIKAGSCADLLLVNTDREEMTPGYNLISDLVYSAHGCCIDTVICAGKILMRNRHVDGEEKIRAKAKETARKLAGKF